MKKDTQRLFSALGDYIAEHRHLTKPDVAAPPAPDLDALVQAKRRAFLDDIENRKRVPPNERRQEPGLLEVLRGLSARWMLPVAALVVVGLVVWSVGMPAGIVLRVDPGDRGGSTPGKPVLPVEIRVNFDKHRIEFRGDGDRLAGTLIETNALSTAQIAVYQVSAQGKDSTGLEAKFEGLARLTRAVPGGPVKRKADVKTIVVEGQLDLGGAGRFPVKRAYFP